MDYIKPRGTKDLFYNEAKLHYKVCHKLFAISATYGYDMVATPIFEYSDLYKRSVGDGTDIVRKELFEFEDKSDRKVSLRPEGTAGVIRSIVENKIIERNPSPIKLSYAGPMFRYERPQKGRLRQFTQFGVENINANSIIYDVELLLMANKMLEGLGIKNYEIVINCLGSFKSRKLWIDDLTRHFFKHKSELSQDSQNRINTNPLRILDDKIDGKLECVKNAPSIFNYLSAEEKGDFFAIQNMLTQSGIKFRVDGNLVRGLDYYTNFVFEIISLDKEMGEQSTLIGGGRYSKLVEELGGQNCNCLGFATGIERLILAMKSEQVEVSNHFLSFFCPTICIAVLEENYKELYILLAEKIRHTLPYLNIIYNADTFKLVKHFRYSLIKHCDYVILAGKDEIAQNSVTIKCEKDGTQQLVKIEAIANYFTKLKLAK